MKHKTNTFMRKVRGLLIAMMAAILGVAAAAAGIVIMEARADDPLEPASYASKEIIRSNNQAGIHYSNFDALSMHTVYHLTPRRNRFTGVTLKFDSAVNRTGFNAFVVQWQTINTGGFVLRAAYNRNPANSTYTRLEFMSPLPANTIDGLFVKNADGTIIRIDDTKSTGTTVPGRTSGFVILPILSTITVDLNSITLYASINNDNIWSKVNIGNAYLANFTPASGEAPAVLEDENLIWSIDFETPNWETDFWNWDAPGATDTALDNFHVTPIHAGEFIAVENPVIMDPGYAERNDSRFDINFGEEMVEALGNGVKVDMRGLKGVLFDVESASDLDFNFRARIASGTDHWEANASNSVLFLPDKGSGYWGKLKIESGFKGKIWIPYNESNWQRTSADAGTLPSSLQVTDAMIILWIPIIPNVGASAFIYSAVWYMDDSAFVTPVNIAPVANGNITVEGAEHGLIPMGNDAVFIVTPDIGYEVSSAKLGGQAVTLSKNTYTVAAYNGALFEVVFSGKSYTVTLSSGEGAVLAQNSANAIYGSSFKLPVPERSGYIFKGWYDGEGGTGNMIADEEGNSIADYSLTQNTTVYAKWEKTEEKKKTGCKNVSAQILLVLSLCSLFLLKKKVV